MKKIVFLFVITIMMGLHQYTLSAQSEPCPFGKNQEVQKISSLIIETPAPPPVDTQFTPPPPPPVDPPPAKRDRVLWWLHGLGGDADSWRPIKTAVEVGATDFPARKLLANYNDTYTDGINTMNVIANDQLGKLRHEADNVLHQTPAEKNQNMLIAHSQGTILARTMNMNAENNTAMQNFGGIVFFDGPHNGAEILRNARAKEDGGTGLGAEVVANFCAAYIDTKVKDVLASLPSIKRFFTKKIIDGIDPVGLCKSDLGISIFQSFIDGLAKQTQTDAFVPGSPHLEDMNDYEFDPSRLFKTHRVNFFSEEPDSGYLVWRTLNYINTPSSAHEPFTANADDGPGTLKSTVDSLMDVFNEMKSDAIHHYNLKLCHTLYVQALPNVWDHQGCRSILNEIHAWENLIEFMNTINNQWRVIIGAKSYERESIKKVTLITKWHHHGAYYKEFTYDVTDSEFTTEQQYNDWAEFYHSNGTFKEYPHPGLEHEQTYSGYELKFEYNYKWIERKSDGVVLLKSQQGTSAVSTLPPQKLYNSSHMQVRNDRNTQWALNLLFDGTMELPIDAPQSMKDSKEWFITPEN